jgi:hypothetical protein
MTLKTGSVVARIGAFLAAKRPGESFDLAEAVASLGLARPPATGTSSYVGRSRRDTTRVQQTLIYARHFGLIDSAPGGYIKLF